MRSRCSTNVNHRAGRRNDGRDSPETAGPGSPYGSPTDDPHTEAPNERHQVRHPAAGAQPGLHAGRGGVAGPGHRREHRHLQHRQHAAHPEHAGAAAEAAGGRVHERARRLPVFHVLVSRLSRPSHIHVVGLPGYRRAGSADLHVGEGGRHQRDPVGRAGDGEPVSSAGRSRNGGTHVPAGRRLNRGCAPCSADQPGILEASLRRLAIRCGQHAAGQRAGADGRGGDAARLHRAVPGAADGPLDPVLHGGVAEPARWRLPPVPWGSKPVPHGPAAARRDGPARPDAGVHGRRAPRCGVSGDQRGPQHDVAVVQQGGVQPHCGSCARAAGRAAHGRGGAGAGHRLRQPGQPAAGACGEPQPRDCHAPGHRRGPGRAWCVSS